jgi:hypothetical protein
MPLLYDIGEIVSINPLVPQSWGTLKAGGHLQTPGRKYPAPLFRQSLYIKSARQDRFETGGRLNVFIVVVEYTSTFPAG